MPLTQTTVPSSLFGDLGRATRRGVRKCPKCGTVTGTRGRSCKNELCDVVYQDVVRYKKSPTESGACRIVISPQNYRGYSVRIRDRGPDYRTFVQLPLHEQEVCASTGIGAASTPLKVPRFGSRCFAETCSRIKTFPCSHIKAAETCTVDAERISIKQSVISSISIPLEAKQVLTNLVALTPDLVQRCSTRSFVVKCNVTSRQPLGYVHMLFFKIDPETSSEQRFLCSCQPLKLLRRQNNGLEKSSISSSTNKYCLHYYACVCAFASSESLNSEFDVFLSRALEVYPATILSQLHLRLVARKMPDSGETFEHPNQIPVEIMRENLSLLESIAAVDDPSTSETVDTVLSEQNIVANADDALNFVDSSTLDSLDETDPNCTTHLTHISEILTPSNASQQVCPILTSPDIQLSKPQLNSSSEVQALTCNSGSSSSPISGDPKLFPSASPHGKRISKSEIDRGSQGTFSEDSMELSEDEDHPQSPSLSSVTVDSISENYDLERRIVLGTFERWLASINERMNAAMNYQLPDTCLLVDFVPRELFEYLKDRIVSGYKKKKYLCQTMMVERKINSPLGTFRKHVWKILSIIHLLHIFQSSLVPLKLSQFFVQMPNGTYAEWIPSKLDRGKNKNHRILPVLHCTKLKVGKLDRGKEKELTPFVIEWIPDILPESNMGELSITFQTTHTGPILSEEDRKACNAPIQRLIQQSQSFSIT